MTNILITTTPTVENRPVREYLGIVSGEAVMDERRLGYYYGISKRTLLEYHRIDNFKEALLEYYRRVGSYYRHSHKLLSKRAGFIPPYISMVIAKLEQMSEQFWKLKAEFHKAQKQAIREMAAEAAKLGANAVIGVKIDYKTSGGFSGYYDEYKCRFSMDAESVWVIATGTAVRL
jgi:uncharacterized protein YbjQ (UPF0145 family)